MKGHIEKFRKEMESTKVKAQAKHEHRSALDLKEEQAKNQPGKEGEESISVAKKQFFSIGTAATTFLVTSSLVLGGLLFLRKQQN